MKVTRSRIVWAVLFVLGVVGLERWLEQGWARTIIAMLAVGAFLKFGFALTGSFARPVPAPPPPGELRRVRLMYRCSICNTEVRMTAANDEVPDPPRHCMDDMELIAPLYD